MLTSQSMNRSTHTKKDCVVADIVNIHRPKSTPNLLYLTLKTYDPIQQCSNLQGRFTRKTSAFGAESVLQGRGSSYIVVRAIH